MDAGTGSFDFSARLDDFRLALLVLVLLVTFALWLMGFLGHLKVCEEIPARVGTQPLIQVCRSPDPADFTVAAGVVVGLLLGGAGEAKITGVGSFKRADGSPRSSPSSDAT